MKYLYLLFLIGCKITWPCHDLTVVEPSDAVKRDALDSLRKGIHMWDQLECRYRLEDELTEIEMEDTKNSSKLQVKEYTYTPEEVGDYNYYPNGDIHIRVELFDYPTMATEVIAHEVGHAMGLEHVPNVLGPAVMNPIENNLTNITQLDYNEWCRHYDCNKDMDK